MIKILGISGSPVEGATAFAVRTSLAAASEIPGIDPFFWSVAGKEVRPCINCEACPPGENEYCIYHDAMDELYELLPTCDGLVIASPVSNGGVSAHLKCILDRFRPFYKAFPYYLENKVGGAIAVGGSRNLGIETTIEAIWQFYVINQIIIVGTHGYGGTIWTRNTGIQGAKEDEIGLASVRDLGRRVAAITALIRKGKEVLSDLKF